MLRRARFLSVSAGTHRTAIWIAKSGGLQFFVAHAIQDRDRRVLNETSGEFLGPQQSASTWPRSSRSPTQQSELGEPYVKTQVRSRTRVEPSASLSPWRICVQPQGSANHRLGSRSRHHRFLCVCQLRSSRVRYVYPECRSVSAAEQWAKLFSVRSINRV